MNPYESPRDAGGHPRESSGVLGLVVAITLTCIALIGIGPGYVFAGVGVIIALFEDWVSLRLFGVVLFVVGVYLLVLWQYHWMPYWTVCAIANAVKAIIEVFSFTKR